MITQSTLKMLFKPWYAILFLTCNISAFAQFDSLGINTKWNKGHIIFQDNRRINGYIKHNDKLGLIAFKNTPEDEEQPISLGIQSMEYFDNELSTIRKFGYFKFNDIEGGRETKLFFEIIMEKSDFALLSHKSTVNPAMRGRQDQFTGMTRTTKVGYEQAERIYIIGVDGEAKLLSTTYDFEKDKAKPFAANTEPHYNKGLMKSFMGDQWETINSFIKDNKLKMAVKDDLLKTFEHYDQLRHGKRF